MEFCSTRDASLRHTAAQAVLRGLAPDGGLYLPTEIPVFSAADIAAMADQSYRQLAESVLRAFLPGYTDEELRAAAAAYDRFDSPEVAPLRTLRPDLFVLELWHGPTCAFKDFALQLLPHLMADAGRKCGDGREIAVLVATSGDTGKAALAGFAGAEGTRIGVFYPDGGVSPIQRLQMVTQTGDNVRVWGVKGNFDDTQNGVKSIFSDPALAERLAARGVALSSANSINFGRLAPQIVYYFRAYSRLLRDGVIQNGTPVDFCVPTGNFGDILAGWYAKHAGLPVGRLICASNRNNVLTQFLNTGLYDKRRTFYKTTSPSMDILISSNLERLLFLLSQDDAAVRRWMELLRRDGFYQVDDGLLHKLGEEFRGYSCDDDRAARTAGEIWERYGYVCDPHTAVAMNAVRQHRALTGEKTPTVVLSTASPFKFPEAVLSSIGIDFTGNDFERLEALSILSAMPVPSGLAGLKTAPVLHERTLARKGMKSAVEEWLL